MKHIFKAVEFFITEKDNNSVFPLDLVFKTTHDPSEYLSGPGIYFLYFKDELVYIGYYFDSTKPKDAIQQRWVKELATISMRGKEIVFSRKAAESHLKCKNYPRFSGEISNKGFQTSAKRVAFADKNWHELNTENFLEQFTFYWFPEEKGLRRSKPELKMVTNQLRKFYKSTCNG